MAFVDEALTWLAERAIQPDGRVASWRNPGHDGFAYPEAAGFALHLWSLDRRPVERAAPIAAALAASVDADGGLGKEGRTYAFDSAVALAALAAHRRNGGTGHEDDEARLAGFVARLLSGQRAVARDETDQPDRWSRSFAPHLIKAASRLRQSSAEHRQVAASAIDELERLFDGERFPMHVNSRRTYLHAHAYALEGLALSGRTDSAAFVHGTRWLAGIQQPDGGIRAWHDGEIAGGPARADATSQAIRLWCIQDRAGYASEIDRGIAFLERTRSVDGGVLYETGSADANTWCTVFAIQAWRWADSGSFDPAELI